MSATNPAKGAPSGRGRFRRMPVRYSGIEYVADGVVFHGKIDRREFVTVNTRVVVEVDTVLDLHLDMQPDVAQYAYTADSFDILLMPVIWPEWTETPIKPADFPLLHAALDTGEIEVRVKTPTEERIFRATHIMSQRWLGERWADPLPDERERLLLPIGRDGALRTHPKAAKVVTVRSPGADEVQVLLLKNLILPPRTTCIFCDDPNPTTVEHVIPNWSRRDDDGGVTVACCDSCNGALSPLEDFLADMSRDRVAFDDLPVQLQQAMYLWGIKTMWALGKALGIDPLRGAGQNDIAVLTARPDLLEATPANDIDGCHASIEPVDHPVDSLQYGPSDQGLPWAKIAIRNVIVSVWMQH